jgi:hypothetical protein
MPWIIESIVTTRNVDGTINIAPQGPLVLDSNPRREPWTKFLFRPFQSSQTFENLVREKCGVLHVVDDPLLVAQAAVDQIDPPPVMRPAEKINGQVIQSACRWYEFKIESIDASQQRSEMQATVVHSGTLRGFCGWNRANHAVLELAIVATRLHILSKDEVNAELKRTQTIVDKTAGPREFEAFEFLKKYIEQRNLRA